MAVPSDQQIDGGCLCGGIRFSLRGNPVASGLCHCPTCRKAAASPVTAWLTIAIENFKLVRGAPAEFRSSPPVTRTFCSNCGTPLTYTNTKRPGQIDVMTCSIDNPEAFPPAFHVWTRYRLSWAQFRDDLPSLPTGEGT